MEQDCGVGAAWEEAALAIDIDALAAQAAAAKQQAQTETWACHLCCDISGEVFDGEPDWGCVCVAMDDDGHYCKDICFRCVWTSSYFDNCYCHYFRSNPEYWTLCTEAERSAARSEAANHVCARHTSTEDRWTLEDHTAAIAHRHERLVSPIWAKWRADIVRRSLVAAKERSARGPARWHCGESGGF